MPKTTSIITKLVKEREFACRLKKKRALKTLNLAREFLFDRGMLTLTADSTLPSLFGACHEAPYAPGRGGFAEWPRTKWWWGGALANMKCVYPTNIRKGKGLYLSTHTAFIIDPLCMEELVKAEDGLYGRDSMELVKYLDKEGPTLIDKIKADLRIKPTALKTIRKKLEPFGIVNARGVTIESNDKHRHTSRLYRWDQFFPKRSKKSPDNALEELIIAGIKACVIVPKNEACGWFSWKLSSELINHLMESKKIIQRDEYFAYS